MDLKKKALELHEQWAGKIEVTTRCEVNSSEDLSLAYTPGVAEPCLKIKDNVDLSYTYTRHTSKITVKSKTDSDITVNRCPPPL